MSKTIFGSRYWIMDQVKFFKGCLPQILLNLFLNTLTHLKIICGLISTANINPLEWQIYTHQYHLAFIQNCIISYEEKFSSCRKDIRTTKSECKSAQWYSFFL